MEVCSARDMAQPQLTKAGFKCRLCDVRKDSYYEEVMHELLSHAGEIEASGCNWDVLFRVVEGVRHKFAMPSKRTTPNSVDEGAQADTPRLDKQDEVADPVNVPMMEAEHPTTEREPEKLTSEPDGQTMEWETESELGKQVMGQEKLKTEPEEQKAEPEKERVEPEPEKLGSSEGSRSDESVLVNGTLRSSSIPAAIWNVKVVLNRAVMMPGGNEVPLEFGSSNDPPLSAEASPDGNGAVGVRSRLRPRNTRK